MKREQIEAEFYKLFHPANDSLYESIISSRDAISFAEHIAKLAVEQERAEILAMSQTQWFKTQAEFEQAIRARIGECT